MFIKKKRPNCCPALTNADYSVVSEVDSMVNIENSYCQLKVMSLLPIAQVFVYVLRKRKYSSVLGIIKCSVLILQHINFIV